MPAFRAKILYMSSWISVYQHLRLLQEERDGEEEAVRGCGEHREGHTNILFLSSSVIYK